MTFSDSIELVGLGVDGAGVALIVIGLLLATGTFFLRVWRHVPAAYQHYREALGRTLLLGLEFLVAADIIRTVAITPTFQSVGILAVIVAIRTFLSWTLELELVGYWPWQRAQATVSSTTGGDARTERSPIDDMEPS